VTGHGRLARGASVDLNHSTIATILDFGTHSYYKLTGSRETLDESLVLSRGCSVAEIALLSHIAEHCSSVICMTASSLEVRFLLFN
jgi:hypothetical protein